MKKIEKKMTEEKQRIAWFKAVRKDDIKTIKKMLEEGWDVNIKYWYGYTALHLACNNGYREIIKLLIDNGADVNKQDENGWTPLRNTCFWGDIETAKLLIENGTDVNIKNIDGYTSLDELKGKHPQKYEELMVWLAEEHPEILIKKTQNKEVKLKKFNVFEDIDKMKEIDKKIRKDLIQHLIKHIPKNDDIQKISKRCWTIQHKKLHMGNLSPAFYDFRHQTKVIINIIKQCELSDIENKLRKIIKEKNAIIGGNKVSFHPKFIEALKNAFDIQVQSEQETEQKENRKAMTPPER